MGSSESKESKAAASRVDIRPDKRTGAAQSTHGRLSERRAAKA